MPGIDGNGTLFEIFTGGRHDLFGVSRSRLISQILIVQEQFEKAETQQQRAMQIAKQMKSIHFEYVALLLQSQLETAKGNEVERIKHLRRALFLIPERLFFVMSSGMPRRWLGCV